MTFTYTPGPMPDDTTKIRYYIGDVDSDAAMYSDEEIGMVLDIEGTVNKAVMSLIRGALARLAQEPDMTADWLKIDWRRSAANWQALLSKYEGEFGLGWSAATTSVAPYRTDSYQDEEPDWDAIFNDQLDDFGRFYFFDD